jgi:hypothetical protein
MAALLISWAAAGCSIVSGPEKPDLQLGFDIEQGSLQNLHLEIDVGGDTFHLDGSRLIDGRAPREGDLPVTVRLLLDGQVLAQTSFDQTFDADYDHWVHGHLGSQRPMGICIGVLSVAPVGPPVADTLFLMHGSIPKGAVC